jgi:hypothetical protein
LVVVFGATDLARDLRDRRGRSKEKASTRREEDPHGECQVIFQKMYWSSKKSMVKSFFSFATFLKQENNGQPDVKRARHPAAKRSSL